MSWLSPKANAQIKKSADISKTIQATEQAQKQITAEEIKALIEPYKIHFDKEVEKYLYKREPFKDSKGANVIMIAVFKELEIGTSKKANSYASVQVPLFDGRFMQMFGTEEQLKALVPKADGKPNYYILRGTATPKYKLAADPKDQYADYLTKFLKKQERDNLDGYKDGDYVVYWNFNLTQVLA